MADKPLVAGASPDTPGNETSEHDAMKKAQVWIRMAAGLLLVIATSVLGAGVLPPDSAWVAVFTMIASIAGVITGEVYTAKNYIQSRTAIKVAKVARGAAPANPPPLP